MGEWAKHSVWSNHVVVLKKYSQESSSASNAELPGASARRSPNSIKAGRSIGRDEDRVVQDLTPYPPA